RLWRETPPERQRLQTAIRRFLNDNMPDEWREKLKFNYVIGFTGLLIVCVILSVETFEFFQLRPEQFDKPLIQGSLALTALWCGIAVLLLVIGLAFKVKTIRVASVILFMLTAAKVMVADFPARPILGNGVEPIWNSCAIVIFVVSVALLSLMLVARYIEEVKTPAGRLCYGGLSLFGLIFICAISSTECWYYFVKYPLNVEPVNEATKYFFARASISILWAAAAFVVLTVGMFAKKMPIRVAGLGILAVTGVKVFAGELYPRPDYGMLLLNPYFLSIAAPVAVAILFAVWGTRLQPVESQEERNALTITGIVGLLFLIAAMSFECWDVVSFGLLWGASTLEDLPKAFFVARTVLTVLWAVWAILLFALGMTCRSQVLRIFGAILLLVSAGGIFIGQLFVRPDYATPIANPYFLPIVFVIVTMFAAAIWGTRLQPLKQKEERQFLTILGLIGLGLAWGAMTVECFGYFKIHTEQNAEFVAHTSVTVFWTILAILIALVGWGSKSKVLHYASIVLLAITLIKVAPYELQNRPDDFGTLLNPFMLAMGLLSATLMVQAVIATRLKPAERIVERQIMFALGLFGLILIWISLSGECFRFFKIRASDHSVFVAYSSLTVFWTILAVVLLLIAQAARSLPLRITGTVLLGVTFAKSVPLELLQRPDDLAPLLNPFMPTLTLLSLVLIGTGLFAIGRSSRGSGTIVSTERLTGRVLAFVGLALLFAGSSIECHDSVRAHYGDNESAWVAQMAISILWSVFAGVLIFIGFVWRSTSLRWVAIALFAITTCKVLFNDMAGFDRIYRIGAFTVLAIVMTLAALAYQRFKPDNTPPNNTEQDDAEQD
ncbi:MAG: DUF2339 domain-containing protein, partial [Planctomycetaceae bacterium]|nr:DUF2339 domain-containing protein [Planctomycetaceae bacterium]